MDTGFAPTPLQIGRGDTVVWENVGTAVHRADDASAMALFDTGDLPSGWSGWFTFDAAGRYASALDGIKAGRVDVPVGSDRTRAGLAHRFTITWATARATTGWVYDVQIRRPGRSWRLWKDDMVAPSATFRADSGAGTYRFRARLVAVPSGAHCGWSAPRTIRIGS